MTERRVTVARETGLHARPARAVAESAADFDASVTVEYDGETARAASALELTALGVRSGESVTVRAAGDDADRAVAAVAAVLAEEGDP
ncbi:HPr family phosphocarrier protein [Halorussus gelatinilyticus]|uniref:HPr family phosphocarrier protein n=1 Tax=Halorussus gelatinilyticus TaxID=2937524 RepID=A0A8U0IKJ7_9EURY|nr:HPr family phosphocarrier protein [Halorussus gelatinilyticus]UPW01195.1 HPr family phosphocarrier protein [Halorussus gelatinilyticus]